MVERPIQNRYYTSTHWSNLVMYDYVLDLRQDADDAVEKRVLEPAGAYQEAPADCSSWPVGTEMPSGREAYADLMETMFSARNSVC